MDFCGSRRVRGVLAGRKRAFKPMENMTVSGGEGRRCSSYDSNRLTRDYELNRIWLMGKGVHGVRQRSMNGAEGWRSNPVMMPVMML